MEERRLASRLAVSGGSSASAACGEGGAEGGAEGGGEGRGEDAREDALEEAREEAASEDASAVRAAEGGGSRAVKAKALKSTQGRFEGCGLHFEESLFPRTLSLSLSLAFPSSCAVVSAVVPSEAEGDDAASAPRRAVGDVLFLGSRRHDRFRGPRR